jgi:hypothetical protein
MNKSDGGHLPPSLRVVRAVAAAEGVDPTDLPPLNDAVDVDALDRLAGADGARPGVEVRFAYAGRSVRVRDDTVTLDGEPVAATGPTLK